MFGADKQAHTDAKVGPKMTGDVTKESQSVAEISFGTSRERGKASLAAAAPPGCLSLWVPGVDR